MNLLPDSPDKQARSTRNLLLQPNLQLRLGVVSILMAVIFSALIFGIIYLNLSNFYSMVLDLSPLHQEVSDILNEYIRGLSTWIIFLIIIYMIVTVFLSVYYTHRLVGPSIAFRRHIRSLILGNFNSRVHLRKNDAFNEVADDLNELAESMQRAQLVKSEDGNL